MIGFTRESISAFAPASNESLNGYGGRSASEPQRNHMADQNRNDQRDKNLAAEERPRPSQAEGPEDKGAPGQGGRPTPSQAEGDDETVKEDLERNR